MPKLPEFLQAENELDGDELVYIAQNSKTRKTTLQKIKEFIIGTTALLTTDKTPTGAINELKDGVDNLTESVADNTTHLNENTQNITLHKSTLVTDVSGVHGLKIESGTWTPTIQGNSGGSGQVYSKQSGTYLLIDKLCYIKCNVSLTAKGTLSGTSLMIGGLPFIGTSRGGFNANGMIAMASNLIYSGVNLQGSASAGASALLMQEMVESGISNISINNVKDTTSIQINGCYEIA